MYLADEDMQREYISQTKSGGQKFDPPKTKRPKPPTRRTPLKQKSEKQELLDAKWEGIKEGFLYMQNRYDEVGAHCESCGVSGDSRTLDLHHLRRRGQGGAYAAHNAQLLCNRFNVHKDNNCHARETGQPQWSGDAA